MGDGCPHQLKLLTKSDDTLIVSWNGLKHADHVREYDSQYAGRGLPRVVREFLRAYTSQMRVDMAKVSEELYTTKVQGKFICDNDSIPMNHKNKEKVRRAIWRLKEPGMKKMIASSLGELKELVGKYKGSVEALNDTSIDGDQWVCIYDKIELGEFCVSFPTRNKCLKALDNVNLGLGGLFLQADGSFRLNLEEFPLFPIGTVDLQGASHPISISVMRSENSSDMRPVFQITMEAILTVAMGELKIDRAAAEEKFCRV